ncbi:MAG: hypothetical protein H3C46_00670 [Ignavibacteria bacterium]|nr:hypothetical protein [Ignavibacteria bacterium]
MLTVVLALFTAKILTAQSEDTLLDPINKSENLIHNPVSIQNIFNSVLSDNVKRYPARIFIMGDSYIESGDFASGFQTKISSFYGNGGKVLLAINGQFPNTVSTRETKLTGEQKIVGFDLLTNGQNFTPLVRSQNGEPVELTPVPSDRKNLISFNFSQSLSSFYISSGKNVPAQPVLGIILRYENSGVVTGYYGKSSTSLRNWNTGMNQAYDVIRSFNADLIIINLGINDCAGTNFNKKYAEVELNQLIKKIRLHSPNSALLFISPPGFYKQGKEGFAETPNVTIMREVLAELSVKHNFAWWDMKAVMGGDSSMAVWVKQGLALFDYVHLKPNGSQLLSMSLAEAIKESESTLVNEN